VYDLTGSYHTAAELAGCFNHRVARLLAKRDAGGRRGRSAMPRYWTCHLAQRRGGLPQCTLFGDAQVLDALPAHMRDYVQTLRRNRERILSATDLDEWATTEATRPRTRSLGCDV